MELGAPAPVELVLKLDPVESERVQEGLQQVHQQEHANRKTDKDKVRDQQLQVPNVTQVKIDLPL